MDEHAHLTAGGGGGLGERAAELRGGDAVGGDAAAEDALE
jgi:hypothetical protein